MEIIIKTKDEAALRKLLLFIEQIGLEIAASTPNTLVAETKKAEKPNNKKTPKIQWAKEPEKAKELFGTWKDTPMNLAQIRNAAWGTRL